MADVESCSSSEKVKVRNGCESIHLENVGKRVPPAGPDGKARDSISPKSLELHGSEDVLKEGSARGRMRNRDFRRFSGSSSRCRSPSPPRLRNSMQLKAPVSSNKPQ
uniref:Uncharacterized protein n=1 Tax=Timspurckia oligopyrenoides TaxID=708627 RepID=A0A7S0ZG12_9RHOD